MTMPYDTTRLAPPPASAAALQRLVDTELSLSSRLGHVALLLAALAMTFVVAILWATEPVLPLRTQVGFGVMVAMGSGWVAFATWVLTHRRVLFARHRIVAGRMAVTFSAVFAIGAVVLGLATGRSEAYKAAAIGVLMVGAAAAILVRAHRSFARLVERRDSLEREIGTSAR